LDDNENELQRRLAGVEKRMLGRTKELRVDYGFWDHAAADDFSSDAIWPIRILVCGNTGVGKSTLINKVFGVPIVRRFHCPC
jgi:predicted GTPase